MTAEDAAVPALVCRSAPLADAPADLIDCISAARSPASWVRHGEGIVGWGEAARFEPAGRDRFRRADEWWAGVVRRSVVEDPVRAPGSGLVAFVSLAFDGDPGRSVVVVPRVVIGHRHGLAWRTDVLGGTGPGAADGRPEPVRPTRVGAVADGTLGPAAFRDAVAGVVERIRGGEVAKVVLARDLHVTAEDAVDPRDLLSRLARRNPSSWTFCVGGLLGATPELLARKRGEALRSRVLAGTALHPAGRAARPDDLLRSAKDRAEHEFALRSVVEAIGPVSDRTVVPSEPAVLRLASLSHLMSDVDAALRPPTPTLLALARRMHPSAAVGGHPTARALPIIREFERMDRGRYAGPVGWLDAAGGGELGLALRCAEVRGDRLRLFAGCGIVAESDPHRETAESASKLLTMLDALGRG